MLLFLHDDLLKLVKKVLLLIIKPNLVDACSTVYACSTVTELKKIKLTNKDTFLKVKEINLECVTRKCITNLKKSDLVSTKDHVAFINDCISFMTVIVSNLFERSPLSSVIVRNEIEIACREDEILQEKMNAILKHFLKLKIFSPPSCDETLEQHTQFLEEVKRVNSHELIHFKT